MTIEDRVAQSQSSKDAENELIREYVPFILSCANKALGRYITHEDDEFSVAILAFYEAMQKYSQDKGAFLPFARMVIKRRLVDYLRQEYRQKEVVPFSSLQSIDDDNNTIEFEIADIRENGCDARYEIETLTYELKKLGISFFDVAKNSPKSKKTKTGCAAAIRYILSDAALQKTVKEKGYIPSKLITETFGINRKLLERHRNYIIAVVLVMSGDYEIIREYFPYLKGVSG
ncbi:MAG: sigma-70 family RNA polymerase sigma factor [Candidatus Ornithomonoglobus sp.]